MIKYYSSVIPIIDKLYNSDEILRKLREFVIEYIDVLLMKSFESEEEREIRRAAMLREKLLKESENKIDG